MYLTKKEVAEKFKVSQTTVNRWMRNGLKFYRFEQIVRFKEDEVLGFFEVVQKGRKK